MNLNSFLLRGLMMSILLSLGIHSIAQNDVFKKSSEPSLLDEDPDYPGGFEALLKEIADKLEYPIEAQLKGIEGDVMLKFLVLENGEISDVQVLKDIGGGCGQASIEVLNSLSKRFEPAKENGIAVESYYVLPIRFKLAAGDQTMSNSTTSLDGVLNVEDDDEEIFAIVEENAEYPGGNGELLKEIAKNLRYPPLAQEKGIQGKVYLKFIVNEDGSISDINIEKEIGDGCGQAAVDAIKLLSKKFEPGKQKGVPVKVYFTLPVKFTLHSGPNRGKNKKRRSWSTYERAY